MTTKVTDIITLELITDLMRRHCTTLLTDREFDTFVSQYSGTHSKKFRAKYVAALIALFNTRTNDTCNRKLFADTLNTLLGRYNGRLVPDTLITVRHHSTHPAVDWACVGDSIHWHSCLSTGYDTEHGDSYCMANYLNYLGRAPDGYYAMLPSADFNADYAKREMDNNELVVLLTSGNPVYEDGKGYLTRVRLHEGIVTVEASGAVSPPVQLPCLIWDRYYGDESMLLPTWAKAIEYAKQRGLLLLRTTFNTGIRDVEYTARMRNGLLFSDEFSDCKYGTPCEPIHSLHDVYAKRLPGAQPQNRAKLTSLRSYVQVNPKTLSWRYKLTSWAEQFLYDTPYAPEGDYDKLFIPGGKSALRTAVVREVMSHYGYPLCVQRGLSGTTYYFKSSDGVGEWRDIGSYVNVYDLALMVDCLSFHSDCFAVQLHNNKRVLFYVTVNNTVMRIESSTGYPHCSRDGRR